MTVVTWCEDGSVIERYLNQHARPTIDNPGGISDADCSGIWVLGQKAGADSKGQNSQIRE